MYRRITIENYRSIQKATVELSPFTVVVGQNGSGKSNFADAFVFMRDVADDGEAAVSKRGGFSSVARWTPGGAPDVVLEVRVSTTRDMLDSNCLSHSLRIGRQGNDDWRFKSERVSAGRLQLDRQTVANGLAPVGFEKSKWSVAGWATHSHLPLEDGVLPLALLTLGVHRYRLEEQRMGQPQLASSATRLVESGDNIASALRKIIKDGEIDSVLEPMKRIVPGLRDIRVIPAGRHLVLMFDQARGDSVAEFAASEMSHGALRALGAIVAARQAAAGDLIIIEEVEASIHPGAAALLFEVLKEASLHASVLITTHSADLLDAARDENIVVCNWADGVTQIGPLDSGQRDLVRKGLFSLAELMRTEPLRFEGQLPDVAGA